MSLTSPLFFAFLAASHRRLSHQRVRCLSQAGAGIGKCHLHRQLSHRLHPELCRCLLFCCLGYACVSFSMSGSPRLRWRLAIVGVLACYIFLKRFSFFEDLGRLPFPYLTIGLSYILFRILHIMVDVRSGDLEERIGPLAFFRYTCNFLCFVSGPIQRYQDFRDRRKGAGCQLDANRVYEAFSRVVTGYVKFVIIAATAEYAFSYLNPQLLQAATRPSRSSCMLYAPAASLYTVYLYYQFLRIHGHRYRQWGLCSVRRCLKTSTNRFLPAASWSFGSAGT